MQLTETTTVLGLTGALLVAVAAALLLAFARIRALRDEVRRLAHARPVGAGDGLVFSSIHARGESRTYAKGVVGGASDATLTPEEQQALAAARTGSQKA